MKRVTSLASDIGRSLAPFLREQQLVPATFAASAGSIQVAWPWSQRMDACFCHTNSGPNKALLHTVAQPQSPQVWDPVTPNGTPLSLSQLRGVDPFAPVLGEVNIISERLRHSVATTIPALKQAAEYFFRRGVEGKRLRPSLTMLMASALSPSSPTAEVLEVDVRPAAEYAPELRRRQQRIAEIAELIHVASLLHDDVIDDATTRRGILSLNANVGNKTAILAGDFLLARASVSLAALNDCEIVALLSQVIEHLVSGEIMQMTASQDQMLSMDHYIQKTYCKTASLMANSSKAVAVLGGHPVQVSHLAWSYGRHLGLAFQVVDDILDLTASSSILGKPAFNDIKSGLATAPVLYAAEEQPELRRLILRKFKSEGDPEQAVALIEKSQGIERARELAQHHCSMAVEMVHQLPPAQCSHAVEARQALVAMTHKVLSRKK